jgi:hypothetical protein
MPTFKYFATFDESMAVLRALFEQGFGAVVQPAPFEIPQAPEFFEVTDEFVGIMKITPVFYLRGPFTKFPVQFLHADGGPAAGKYLIDPLSAGPLMQSMISRVGTMKGKPQVMPGTISYQNSYKNPETGHWDGPSPELKAAYRKVVATIKNICKPLEGRQGILIAPEARMLAERGEAEILA